MELKEAFNKAGNITIKIGDNTYTIHGTLIHTQVKLPRMPEPITAVLSVGDMQNIDIQRLRGYGLSPAHAEIIKWFATRYVQDVYPEIA